MESGLIKRLLITCFLMAALTGCSHKTLIAPCDGNAAPTKLGNDVAPLGPNLNVTPTAAPPTAQAPDDCGPLKPVND
jgi:hypothetical protein